MDVVSMDTAAECFCACWCSFYYVMPAASHHLAEEHGCNAAMQCRSLNNKQLHFGNGRPPHPSRLGGMKQLSGASANSWMCMCMIMHRMTWCFKGALTVFVHADALHITLQFEARMDLAEQHGCSFNGCCCWMFLCMLMLFLLRYASSKPPSSGGAWM